MARGGYGRGAGIPLKDRVRFVNGVRVPPTDPSSPGGQGPEGDRGEECPGRHCWVAGPVDGAPGRPGLVLEWRRDPVGGWLGRVVYGAQLRPGRWAAVEEWLPAAQLVPRRVPR